MCILLLFHRYPVSAILYTNLGTWLYVVFLTCASSIRLSLSPQLVSLLSSLFSISISISSPLFFIIHLPTKRTKQHNTFKEESIVSVLSWIVILSPSPAILDVFNWGAFPKAEYLSSCLHINPIHNTTKEATTTTLSRYLSLVLICIVVDVFHGLQAQKQ